MSDLHDAGNERGSVAARFGPSHRGVAIEFTGPWVWFWCADDLNAADSAATLAEAMAQIDAALGVAA